MHSCDSPREGRKNLGQSRFSMFCLLKIRDVSVQRNVRVRDFKWVAGSYFMSCLPRM